MKRILMFALPVAVFTVAILFSSCGKSDMQAETNGDQQTLKAVDVKVQVVRPQRLEELILVTGIVKSPEDVQLSPEEGGVLKEWLVELGQPVTKGQIIGRLNDDVAQASFDAAQAQYKSAELNFQKQKGVFEEKAISEVQYKNSEYSRDGAKAAADMALARLERMHLRSPIDGVINDKMKNEGEYAPPGVPVAHIVNLSTIRIEAEVSEQYAGFIHRGDQVRILPDAYRGDTLLGKVNFVGLAVAAGNRTLPIEIRVSNPGLKLKPEMIVRAQILLAVRTNALLLDESLIQLVDRDKMIVYVEVDGKAEERLVVPGARKNGLVEITSGIKPGDRVIITGYQKLVTGQPVTIAS